MIQDIYPSKLHNEYHNNTITGDDYLLIFNDKGETLIGDNSSMSTFPQGRDINKGNSIYLFSVDDKRYFLYNNWDTPKEIALDNYTYYSIKDVRDKVTGADVYAAFTAFHLWKWYVDNQFCGKCGSELHLHDKERALKCDSCGNMVFPRINPAVIVGVTNGDKILITKYRTGYAHSALIAGFTEIGETLEETVAREVMEEAGIKVKNITYYKSQPWGMAQDILMGFYCEVDGDDTIHMDKNELRYAEWVNREDVELQPNNLSLTNEMMQLFKEG